jgi:hypothetical protein
MLGVTRGKLEHLVHVRAGGASETECQKLPVSGCLLPDHVAQFAERF